MQVLDVALLFSIIAFTLYLLAVAGVLGPGIGDIIHLLLVLALLLFLVWLFLRVLGTCTNGRYEFGRPRVLV